MVKRFPVQNLETKNIHASPSSPKNLPFPANGKFLAVLYPQILKMHQGRFSQGVRFSCAPPPTNYKDPASAEGASEEKLAILREILLQLYRKMLF